MNPRRASTHRERPRRRVGARGQQAVAPVPPPVETVASGGSREGGPGVRVVIRNRQRGWRVNTVRLRGLALQLLGEELGLADAEFGVHLVGERAMARLNWQWLRHEGSTDVVTFDHGEGALSGPRRTARLHGECFISVDDAVRQAAEFGTSPDAELVRYVVHGVLHLLGHDDLESGARRTMKRAENRLVRRLTRGAPATDWVVHRRP